jgi:hypothetical protein
VTTQTQKQFNSPPAREPLSLAEVEMLLFHPEMQSGGLQQVPAGLCVRATQGWLSLDVYGQRAR